MYRRPRPRNRGTSLLALALVLGAAAGLLGLAAAQRGRSGQRAVDALARDLVERDLLEGALGA